MVNLLAPSCHPRLCSALQIKQVSASNPQLAYTTAVLEAQGGGTSYVLGISHVSRESCQQIEDLIRAVKPDIVLVELCKDRTG